MVSKMVQWKPVPKYEGLYEVSSDGRIRSLDRITPTFIQGRHSTRFSAGRVLAPAKTTYGYPVVNLSKNGNHRTTAIHIAVCSAFHGPRPTPRHQVAHNDGDPANARADNLRWATKSENEADKAGHGTLRTRANGQGKLSEEDLLDVIRRRLSGEIKRTIAADYGICPDYVRKLTKWHVEGRPRPWR